MLKPRRSIKIHHVLGLSTVLLQSLCKTKWLLKLGWGWHYVCSNSNAIKQNESKNKHSTFWVFYIAVLTNSDAFNAMFSNKPQLVCYFQRYKQLKVLQNNRTQINLFVLFGCISKWIFASSDSFCLIIPYSWIYHTCPFFLFFFLSGFATIIIS